MICFPIQRSHDSLLHKKKKKNEVYKRNHSNIEFEEI